MEKRLENRLVRIAYRFLTVKYPGWVQVTALFIMFIFLAVALFLKNRFLPVVILTLDTASRI